MLLLLLLFCLRYQKAGYYITFSEKINVAGKRVRIVAYPKWRFTCVVFYNVQVNYCCVPRNSTLLIHTVASHSMLGSRPQLVELYGAVRTAKDSGKFLYSSYWSRN